VSAQTESAFDDSIWRLKMSLTYYPYLRGRQFELLALRDLVNNGWISERVVPVIEPVRFSPTLIKTLQAFKEKNKSYALIENPQYGSFWDQMSKDQKSQEQYADSISESKKITAFLMNESAVAKLHGISHDNLMVINEEMDCYAFYTKVFGEDEEPTYTLIPDKRQFKRRIQNGKILLEDHFPMKDRNADYAKKDDEFFSDDHIGTESEGYIGFSDYSVIGAKYNESGFAPLAVAIHVVYFDKNNDLRVHHFVSDSNEDIQDPAGKYGEAIDKLDTWYTQNKPFRTHGLEFLLDTNKNRRYPGLGTVKKYSIMHHLELMDHYLNGVE